MSVFKLAVNLRRFFMSNANMTQPSLMRLFSEFFQICSLTLGGGLCIIPIIQKSVVEKYAWIDEQEFINITAITNAAPGAIALNAAIYLGYKLRGFAGALAAALGVLTPSFFIILLLAIFFRNYQDNYWIQKFFTAVRPVVVAIILAAAWRLGRVTIKTGFDWLLLIATIPLLLAIGLHPALIIAGGALVGLIYNRASKQQKNITEKQA